MTNELQSSDGYRQRAKELRAKVPTLNQASARVTLLCVAAEYEALAASIEAMARLMDKAPDTHRTISRARGLETSTSLTPGGGRP